MFQSLELTGLSKHLLWKGIKAVGLLGVGEGHSHPRGEGGVQDDGSTLVPRRKVHRGHRADTLTVKDDVLRTDPISGDKIKDIISQNQLVENYFPV